LAEAGSEVNDLLIELFQGIARFDRACFRLMHVLRVSRQAKYRLRLLHVDSGLPETELSQILPVEIQQGRWGRDRI